MLINIKIWIYIQTVTRACLFESCKLSSTSECSVFANHRRIPVNRICIDRTESPVGTFWTHFLFSKKGLMRVTLHNTIVNMVKFLAPGHAKMLLETRAGNANDDVIVPPRDRQASQASPSLLTLKKKSYTHHFFLSFFSLCEQLSKHTLSCLSCFVSLLALAFEVSSIVTIISRITIAWFLKNWNISKLILTVGKLNKGG